MYVNTHTHTIMSMKIYKVHVNITKYTVYALQNVVGRKPFGQDRDKWESNRPVWGQPLSQPPTNRTLKLNSSEQRSSEEFSQVGLPQAQKPTQNWETFS